MQTLPTLCTYGKNSIQPGSEVLSCVTFGCGHCGQEMTARKLRNVEPTHSIFLVLFKSWTLTFITLRTGMYIPQEGMIQYTFNYIMILNRFSQYFWHGSILRSDICSFSPISKSVGSQLDLFVFSLTLLERSQDIQPLVFSIFNSKIKILNSLSVVIYGRFLNVLGFLSEPCK